MDLDRRFVSDAKPMARDRTEISKKRVGAQRGKNRFRFLESLTRDLAAAGFRVRKPNKRDETWRFTPPDHQAQGIHLRKLRHRQIAASRDFVERMETGGVLALFGDGRSVNPDLIRPQIRFCVTQADHEIFRFGKLFQKVPTTNRVGRQVRCLVYDVGQSCSYLMGVFELTSSAYTLGCRDDYLGWRGKRRGFAGRSCCSIRRLADTQRYRCADRPRE
jgi:hypothetical protein